MYEIVQFTRYLWLLILKTKKKFVIKSSIWIRIRIRIGSRLNDFVDPDLPKFGICIRIRIVVNTDPQTWFENPDAFSLKRYCNCIQSLMSCFPSFLDSSLGNFWFFTVLVAKAYILTKKILNKLTYFCFINESFVFLLIFLYFQFYGANFFVSNYLRVLTRNYA
jgi:hypothetical protein